MPNNAVQFLSLNEVIGIHTALIKHYGGPDGIRDIGLLESALYRPRSGYYTKLDEMAAAMFESIINNYPFVGGNKRVAFFAADVFLRMNEYKLQIEAKSAHRFLMGLFENNNCDLEHLRPWVREFIGKT
ncbi:MAG TPA: type II toxin-antitoxin system death-on-curing family toxin [Gammaproteobacteria bacterium]|nr:type II toxin-antitoxin system death-on-curing family toxin [Gammaproteobacteria bacterium]